MFHDAIQRLKTILCMSLGVTFIGALLSAYALKVDALTSAEQLCFSIVALGLCVAFFASLLALAWLMLVRFDGQDPRGREDIPMTRPAPVDIRGRSFMTIFSRERTSRC